MGFRLGRGPRRVRPLSVSPFPQAQDRKPRRVKATSLAAQLVFPISVLSSQSTLCPEQSTVPLPLFHSRLPPPGRLSFHVISSSSRSQSGRWSTAHIFAASLKTT